MKTTVSNLRTLVERIILEDARMHRCMNGSIVPEESDECLGDLCGRIDDAVYQRNNMTGGTANRAYYNGILADLRKKQRRLMKSFGFSL